jgi:hypothetical protein
MPVQLRRGPDYTGGDSETSSPRITEVFVRIRGRLIRRSGGSRNYRSGYKGGYFHEGRRVKWPPCSVPAPTDVKFTRNQSANH